MTDEEGALNFGGRRPKPRHVFMGLLLAVAVASGVAGVVTQNNTILLVANGGLLGAFVLYIIDNNVRAEAMANRIHGDIGRIERLRGPEHIYDLGMAALDRAQAEGQWESLRIYAPTGLWDKSEKKLRWLRRLQDGLGHDVKEVRAVYGLPEQESVFHKIAAPRLRLFENSPEARLHFLPPPVEGHPCCAPAFGILIFERANTYLTYFACSGSASGPIAGSGFGVQAGSLGRVVAQWFDEQILHGVSARYVLKGPGGPNGEVVSLDDGLNNAAGTYRSQGRAGRVTKSYDDFYASSTELVRQAAEVIRDMVFGMAPKVSIQWLEAVADQLAQSKRCGTGLRFEVLLAIDLSTHGEDLIELHESIMKMFVEREVAQEVSLHLLDMRPPIGFDILMIDRRHVALNLTPVEREYKRRSAVFQDRADMAEPLTEWFDELVRRATRYEIWLGHFQSDAESTHASGAGGE